MKLVNIHTHKEYFEKNTISVYNAPVNNFDILESGNIKTLYSAGIHPWDVEHATEKTLINLRQHLQYKNMIFIGECGLDKSIKTKFDTQLYFFEKQIELSEHTKKPLIVHCVGYFNEIIRLRKSIVPFQKWIIHGFRGKPQLASQLLNVGFGISFGEKFNTESVAITPIKKLFIETDESNFPVGRIYESVAKIKNCNPEDLNAGFHLINSQLDN
ncbi:MAG: TatD family hydrolase [Paludibacteraceae bacterium]